MIERLSEEELWRQRGGQMSDPPVSRANRLDGREDATIRRMGRAEARVSLNSWTAFAVSRNIVAPMNLGNAADASRLKGRFGEWVDQVKDHQPPDGAG